MLKRFMTKFPILKKKNLFIMLFLIHNIPEGMKPIKIAGKLGVKDNSVRKIIWD